MNNMRRKMCQIIVCILLVAVGFLAVYFCISKISEQLSEQIEMNLKDVAGQNKLLIEEEIIEKQLLLESIAEDLKGTYDDNFLVVEHLKPYAKTYDFKRMGYMSLDGHAVTTDGYEYNFSGGKQYEAVLRGENYISGIARDKIGYDEYINVLSVPVYSTDNEVEGAVFAVYRTNELRKIFNVSSFEGEGSTMVVMADGGLIAQVGFVAMENQDDIFDYIIQMDSGNEAIVNELKADLGQGRSVQILAEGNNSCFMCFEALDFKFDNQMCYIVTVVPETVLEQRVNKLWGYVESFMFVIVIVLALGSAFVLYTYLKQNREVVELAYGDKVTGGRNYAYFTYKLVNRNGKTRKKAIQGYIISMDIDEFRIINNICGVRVGDVLLKKIWLVIDNNLKNNESHARVNADRYIIYMQAENREELPARINKITEEILAEEERMNIPKVMPYYGIYAIDNFNNIERAYGYANQAKHIVKGESTYTENYCFYEDGDYQYRIERKMMEDDFEDSIRERRFEVWYQPKYRAKDSHIVSAEALVRWRSKEGKLISPAKFIPLFEKNGKIAQLDEYVFDAVCRRQKKWVEEGRVVRPVSVNISRVSLYYENIASRYRQIVDSYGLDVKLLQVEITESATVENEGIHKLMDQFHREGFTILLDDFGTGYSSLAALNELQFDILKIDKSLVDYIGNSKGETLLVHIVKLAQQLGLSITAEGVETENQLEFLRCIECDDIQGYYFSKPLPEAEYEVKLV